MKSSEKQSGDFKRKTVINKEKSKKLAEQADAFLAELTENCTPNLPATIVPAGKRQRKT
jgi:seryl-tRNA synthetase